MRGGRIPTALNKGDAKQTGMTSSSIRPWTKRQIEKTTEAAKARKVYHFSFCELV
jgi:hypothetical protein